MGFLPEHISRKINFISLLAMWALLARHSDYGSEVQKWFIPWFATWSVPWFFVVSGFFFSRTISRYSVKEVASKKIKSLLFPYLICCLAGWMIWEQYYPAGTKPDGAFDYFRAIFGVWHQVNPVGNYALWYAKALMIFFVATLISFKIFTLVFHSRMKILRIGVVPMAVLGVRWIVQRLGIPVSPGGSPMFFWLGFVLGEIFYKSVDAKRPFRSVYMYAFMGICGVLICAIKVCWPDITWVQNVGYLLIICVLWCLFDCVEIPSMFLRICEVTSFVYFIHHPIYWRLRDCVGDCYGQCFGAVAWNACYLMKVIVIPLVVYGVAILIRRFFPCFYSIISGGR